MNLRYLDYLRLVIDHGSFAAAAAAGGVSQPAVSHGMRQLQSHFEAPLFRRAGRRQVPTDTALRAALHGAELADRLDTLALSHGAGRRETLCVGATASAALLCGPALVAIWCEGRPRRRLEMSTADEGRMLARLQGGELDLVISPMPRGFAGTGLVGEPLYGITPQVYARRGHPLRTAASLADLAGAAWAIVGPSVSGPVDVLSEAFSVRRMRPPRVAASCPDYASLLHLVAQHDLLAVLPHPALLGGAAPGTIVPLRLQEALPRYDMHAFVPGRRRRAVRAVVGALTESLAAAAAAPR